MTSYSLVDKYSTIVWEPAASWKWKQQACLKPFCARLHGVTSHNTFKVCKSVHHRIIQINHQPAATILQFIILTFIYSSTCFGRFPAHHQELNECSGSLWFYLRIVVTAGPTTNTARLSPRHEGKTRGCQCSHWAPDDGRENARNMLSCKQTSG